jgi:D-amino peptidase
MKKFFISADMEGCAAVSSQHALVPDRWEWTAARRWMTEEVVAASEAAFAAGYDQIIVADGHGNAHNIDPDALPDDVWLIRSWPRPLMQMQGVQDPDVAACAFIGYHAGPAAQGSVMAHSFHGGAFRSVRLNGEDCSEGYLNAALAGELGRPVIFVAGDAHTVEDARRYAPESAGFVTKHSLGWRSQMSLPPAQVRRKLKGAIGDALARPLPDPFVLRGPFRLELEMTTQAAAEMLAYLPGVEQFSACGVVAVFDRLEAVMRFVAFATLYSPTGAIAL